MRAFQSHPQSPALACPEFRYPVPIVVELRPPATVPGKREVVGNHRVGLLYCKFETQAVFGRLRHADYHTGDVDIPPFDIRRQRICQTQTGQQAGPGKTKYRSSRDPQPRPATSAAQEHRPDEKQHGASPDWGQPRQKLAHQATQGKEDGEATHDFVIIACHRQPTSQLFDRIAAGRHFPSTGEYTMAYDNDSDVLRRARLSIVAALSGFALVMVFGTVGYKILGEPENSWIDALYMTFLMVATIGYGNGIEVFHHHNTELFTMLVAFSGIGIMTYLFSSVTALVLASDLDLTMRKRRMEKVIRDMKGHFVLCGFGRVGFNVAQELESTHRQYIAIDENQDVLVAAAEKRPGLIFLHGDAADEDALGKANIDNARGVFAITGDDSRNLMITVTARQMSTKVRIVARCNDMRNVEKLRRAGADAIVSPNFTGGMRIASAMIRPNVVSFLDEMLRSEQRLRVEEVAVPEGFPPTPVSELGLSAEDYLLVAVRTRNDWKFNPPAAFVVEAGFHVIAMASPHGRLELERKLADRARANGRA
jgi:voltage-gated potassium channel